MQINNFSKQILVRIQRKTNPLHRWWKNKLRHAMEISMEHQMGTSLDVCPHMNG